MFDAGESLRLTSSKDFRQCNFGTKYRAKMKIRRNTADFQNVILPRLHDGKRQNELLDFVHCDVICRGGRICDSADLFGVTDNKQILDLAFEFLGKSVDGT